MTHKKRAQQQRANDDHHDRLLSLLSERPLGQAATDLIEDEKARLENTEWTSQQCRRFVKWTNNGTQLRHSALRRAKKAEEAEQKEPVRDPRKFSRKELIDDLEKNLKTLEDLQEAGSIASGEEEAGAQSADVPGGADVLKLLQMFQRTRRLSSMANEFQVAKMTKSSSSAAQSRKMSWADKVSAEFASLKQQERHYSYAPLLHDQADVAAGLVGTSKGEAGVKKEKEAAAGGTKMITQKHKTIARKMKEKAADEDKAETVVSEQAKDKQDAVEVSQKPQENAKTTSAIQEEAREQKKHEVGRAEEDLMVEQEDGAGELDQMENEETQDGEGTADQEAKQ